MRYIWTFVIAVICLAKYGVAPNTCKLGAQSEDINWYRISKMNRTWYDVIKTKPVTVGSDCYNWFNIRPTKDGYATDISLIHYENAYETNDYLHRGVRTKLRGVYCLLQEDKYSYTEAEVNAVKRVAEENKEEKIEDFADDLFSSRHIFITDYESYFASVSCTKNGWEVWAKSTTQTPSRTQILKIWRAMAYLGINAEIYLSTCVSERKCDRI